MPLLTIVIPVYNAENYLKPCLDSVAAQEFTDYELVLVDDGSADGSGRICDEYAVRDPRIRVIHQSNGGQAAARNRGIDAAVGDYVGFCDNDDILHPSIFRVLLENAGAAGTDISACSYNERDMRGKVSHDRHSGETFYLSNRGGMEQFLSREKMDIYVWTKIYRRTFLEAHGIRFEQGRNDEDFCSIMPLSGGQDRLYLPTGPCIPTMCGMIRNAGCFIRRIYGVTCTTPCIVLIRSSLGYAGSIRNCFLWPNGRQSVTT